MNVAAKLTAFAALLALVFGAAIAIGSVSNVAPDRAGRSAAGHAYQAAGMAGMAQGGHGAPEAPRGLAVADGKLPRRRHHHLPAGPGPAVHVPHRGQARHDGPRLRVDNTKRLHLIAVRRDLTGYQHVHPVEAADGSWSVPLRFAEPGIYRVYADFTAHGAEKTTLATDVFVPGDFQPRAIPAPASRVSVDGYDVAVQGAPKAGAEGDLEFTVSKGGRPVVVQPYLRADGHLVALRQGDLAYLHVHPQQAGAPGGPIRFMTEYPSAGRYRLFLQFKHGGRIHTAAFSQEVI